MRELGVHDADVEHMLLAGAAGRDGLGGPLMVAVYRAVCADGGSMLTVGRPLRWARTGVRYVDRSE